MKHPKQGQVPEGQPANAAPAAPNPRPKVRAQRYAPAAQDQGRQESCEWCQPTGGEQGPGGGGGARMRPSWRDRDTSKRFWWRERA